jgi:hypothetical protein
MRRYPLSGGLCPRNAPKIPKKWGQNWIRDVSYDDLEYSKSAMTTVFLISDLSRHAFDDVFQKYTFLIYTNGG